MDPAVTNLSVVIPVFNFADFLGATLESVIPQARHHNVEVIVFDGGSTDNTFEEVKHYQKNYANLRYSKNLERGGIDNDMAAAIEISRARFCWLFSGDDLMREGAIQQVLSSLEKFSPDLILCKHAECHVDMTRISDWPVLDCEESRLFDLSSLEDRRNYLSSALTSEAFFSFMGGLVINRRAWLSQKPNPELSRSCWSHVARLWALGNAEFKLYYLNQVLLDRRGGNDSFSAEGSLARLKIQINGLLDSMGSLFSDGSIEISALKRVIRKEVEPHWAPAVRAELSTQHNPQKELAELDQLLRRLSE